MRETYLDVARGVGIILVVFGHVQRGASDAGLLLATYPFKILDYSLYTFHMPLFFLLSGIHVWASLEKGKSRFLKSKIKSIVVPYFVWSIIQGGVQIAMSGSVNHPLHLSDWPHLFYAPIGQFWFLYALMVWQIIALLSYPYKNILSIIAIVSFVLGQFVHAEFLAELMKMGLFFTLGTVFGSQIVSYFREQSSVPNLALAVGAFVGAVYLIWGHARYDSWLALPAAASGIYIVLMSCRIIDGVSISTMLRYLGQKSMAIYVMHIMAASGARIILIKLGMHNMVVHLAGGVVVGIVLPVLVDLGIQRAKSSIQQAWGGPAAREG